jgi:hypothetical protein
MSLKNPVTPSGIDPGTVRLVAQRLNHYATPGPSQIYTLKYFISTATCSRASALPSGSLNFVLAEVTNYDNYNSIQAVNRCVMDCTNVHQMWRLFGGCIYNVDSRMLLYLVCR